MRRRVRATVVAGVCALALPAVAHASGATAGEPVGTWLVTQSNGVSGNELILLRAGADGVPHVRQRVATGGLGSGLSLHAAASVVALESGLVAAVDARSNDIAVARLVHGRLHLVGRTPSLGGVPTSIAAAGSLLYVLNAGVLNTGTRVSQASLQGFRIGEDGSLAALPSARLLLPDTCAAYPCPSASRYSQVGLTRDGRQLLVSDTTGDRVLSASVAADGRPGALHVAPVAGAFGFTIDDGGRTIVTNAGEPQSYVTSGVLVRGRWRAVGNPVLTPLAANCWVLARGERAYVAGAPHAPLPAGITTMALVDGRAVGVQGSATVAVADPPTPPLDLAIAPDGGHLYAVSPSAVLTFAIDGTGVAVQVPAGTVSLLFPGTRLVGLAALSSH